LEGRGESEDEEDGGNTIEKEGAKRVWVKAQLQVCSSNESKKKKKLFGLKSEPL